MNGQLINGHISIDMSAREKTGVIPTGLSAVTGYSNHLKTWSESLKAKNPNFNHKVAFMNLMLANDDSTKAYLEAFVKPLRETLKKYEEMVAARGMTSVMSQKISAVKSDIAFMEGRMEQSRVLFSESALGGMLKPNQQLTLPLQYLEAIQNTSRHVVPFDTCEARTMIRQRVLRQLVVEGKKYILPDAYRDPELLAKIMGKDTKKREYTCDVSAGKTSFDLLDLAFGADATKGIDKLNPLAILKSITVADTDADSNPITTTIGVPAQHNDSNITYRSRGKFGLSIVHPTKSDTAYTIAGFMDFETGFVDIVKSADVKSVTFELSLNGGNFPKTFTPIETREDKDFVVDNQISAQFTWNPVDLQDKLTLENIDALMSATSTIYETATNLKDFYVFEELKAYWGVLQTDRYYTGMYSYHQQWEQDVKLYPDQAANMQYMATNPIEWRKSALAEGTDILCTNYGMKLNTQEGYTSVFWANPQNTRLFGNVEMVFGEGESYGGVAQPAVVKTGVVAGKNIRIVDTQRSKEREVTTTLVGETTTTVTTKHIPSIVLSNAPNEETFKFWQWMTYFDQNGQIRNPNDLVHPTISYLDFFKLDMVHGLMGRVNLHNFDKYIGV